MRKNRESQKRFFLLFLLHRSEVSAVNGWKARKEEGRGRRGCDCLQVPKLMCSIKGPLRKAAGFDWVLDSATTPPPDDSAVVYFSVERKIDFQYVRVVAFTRLRRGKPGLHEFVGFRRTRMTEMFV